MLQVLTHNILPVFVLLALGFIMGRTGAARQEEARAVNRIAFLILQPPLLFLLLTGLDLPTIRWEALGLYFVAEVIAFLVTFAVARTVFACEVAEALLLGMCVIFVNSLLYIWPIATLIYGEAEARPVAAVVALDATIWFPFFIVLMELVKDRGSPRAALPRIARNPILITILVSIAIKLAGISIPDPVTTTARFAGAAAAPMTLFAMGVVLSAHPALPTAAVGAISALKLLLLPALVWVLFTAIAPENAWRQLFILIAAGPAGAMAFALALLYDVRTDRIAPVIVWTSLFSLISLAWLA